MTHEGQAIFEGWKGNPSLARQECLMLVGHVAGVAIEESLSNLDDEELRRLALDPFRVVTTIILSPSR